MVLSMTKRGTPKPFAMPVAALLALWVVPLVAMPANAVTPNFEIDGNQTHERAEDWEDLTPGTMANTATKSHRELVTFVDNSSQTGADETVFGENNKEDAPGGVQWPTWVATDNGNATGKSDYGRIGSYSYVENNHVFLVLGFDRGSNSQGNATDNYYFELNQARPQEGNDPNPVRTIGDVRINLNDDGSDLFTTAVEVWDGDSWEPAPASGDFVVESNEDAISDLAPWWESLNAPAGAITPEGFIELSLDLTSFGVVLGCPSSGFKTLNGRSTTGESEKNLVDYFAAKPINIPSTCGSLVINKTDETGKPLGGATFTISPNPLPIGTPGRPSGNSVTIFDDSDANVTVESGTNYDDPDAAAGRISLPAVVPDVTYTITEVGVPGGYAGASPKTIKPAAFSENSTVSFVNTRLRGALTISKRATGGAGTFVFDITCGGVAMNPVTIQVGADATQQVVVANNIPADTKCIVSERDNPLFTKTATVPANGTVIIEGNQNKTVAFTNARNLGRITVMKNITGTATGTSTTFTFTVDCDGTAYDQTVKVAVTSGTSGSATTGLIPTGTACKVTEASSPDWKLESVVPAGGAVTVPATVTFTNSPVVEVLPVKQSKPPAVLPRTGAGVQSALLAAGAVLLLGLGLLLMAGSRRRTTADGDHRQ